MFDVTSVKRRTVLPIAALFASTLGAHADAQRAPEKTLPFHTKVFSTDSLNVSSPTLSPDGRWIVFSTYDPGRANLWVVPAAGGSPIALTTGAHVDNLPEWFPAGDKIAFTSDRTGGVMVLGVDAKTGHAVGTPRRVTLDKADAFAISPDGGHIAYVTQLSPSRSAIRLVPAVGGAATTVVELNGESRSPLAFSPDGRELYFMQGDHNTPRALDMMRVSTTGGTPQRVVSAFTGTTAWRWTRALPALQRLMRFRGASGGGHVDLLSFAGDTLASFAVASTGQIDPVRDGRSALVTADRTIAPIRSVSLDGVGRFVTNGSTYDWPWAISPDGGRILASADSVPFDFVLMNLDGTHRKAVSARPKNVSFAGVVRGDQLAFSPDLRYAMVMPDSQNKSTDWSWYIVDLETREARTVTHHGGQGTAITNGGVWNSMNHGEFIYREHVGDHEVELRGVKPTGETRVIRHFPRSVVAHWGRGTIALEGDMVAYAQVAGDSTTVFVAHGNDEAKALLSLRGRAEEFAFSPNGKWLAASITGRDSTKNGVGELAFIPLDQPSRTRFITAGDGGFQITWTRDNRAVFYLRADKNWAAMSVWRYPVAADEAPINVTRNEKALIWGYVAAPDGKSVLIPAEETRGVTVWRVNFDEAIAAYRERTGTATQAGTKRPH